MNGGGIRRTNGFFVWLDRGQGLAPAFAARAMANELVQLATAPEIAQ